VTTAALWALKLQSELVYQGDPGDTATTSATTRVGLEVLANWKVNSRLNLEGSAAFTRARYNDDAAGGDRIPNALEYVLTAGATLRLGERDGAEFTVRRLGPAPLIETNAQRFQPATIANAAYNHRLGRTTLSLAVLNLLDSHDNDITYFYTSRLPGEPVAGVADYHFHRFEPREVRVAAR
jgi:hypothetical protein